jgi:NAD-dependent dihydropyrimidine dehydrogenase PreA subunit
MIASTTLPRVILYEGPGAEPLEAATRRDLFMRLLDRGYAVTLAGHGSSPTPPDAAVIVLGCFQGSTPEVEGRGPVSVRDISGEPVEQVVDAVEAARGSQPMNRPEAAAAEAGGETWKPWFPVIDMDRCTNCMQCLSFCLFDVYGVSEDHHLQVENPANCKVNCPACSRVCPDVAIMFPKYHAGPIDGAPVSESDVSREKMKVDISALLGGDIYAKLRERSAGAKARFSRERSEDQALAERRRCLKKLADAAAIPREVLDALPTPEEIQRRAAEAAARAEAARAAAEAAT